MWAALTGRSSARHDTPSAAGSARWSVTNPSTHELRFQLRDRRLTRLAMCDAADRAAGWAIDPATRFVFDLSDVQEIESCCSIICALFIRVARGRQHPCRIIGLNPRVAMILAFLFRRVRCVVLEHAAPAA